MVYNTLSFYYTKIKIKENTMIDAHIVDVSSIKKILSNCTYYDLIIDYEFNYNDKTTIDLYLLAI